jgi:hypothetical protein
MAGHLRIIQPVGDVQSRALELERGSVDFAVRLDYGPLVVPGIRRLIRYERLQPLHTRIAGSRSAATLRDVGQQRTGCALYLRGCLLRAASEQLCEFGECLSGTG